MSTPPAVRVENLSKTYHNGLRRKAVRALDEVTLEVRPGEIFGLLGPNGAGKTTLIKILLGAVHASSGTASLFGQSTHTPAARRRVGYLPEHHRFPGFLSTEKLLDLYGRLSNVPADARRQRIPALLERVGMRDWQNEKVKTFSKGMLQRTGLAQALLNDPDLVFLDEPTDGVDPVGRRQIRDLLLWMREEGKTIFLNSHLLSEVEQICTHVAILNEGKLVRQGTIDELTAVERVYALTTTPIPPEVLNALGDTITPAGEAPSNQPALRRYRIMTQDRAHLNAALDHLRTADVEIESVQPLRRTLEEYFIEVVEEKGGKGERGKG